MNHIEEALTDYWGEKCKDFDEDCPCCQAWAEYEELIQKIILYGSIPPNNKTKMYQKLGD